MIKQFCKYSFLFIAFLAFIENTVVTEYESVKARSESYQNEAELEQEFIRLLCEQGYEYLTIHTETDLISNLRKKLEELNGYQFTDAEWKRFFSDCIANANDGIAEKTRKIQEDNVQVLKRDDGSSKNITLIDKKNIHNNRLQVINQYAISKEEGAKHSNNFNSICTYYSPLQKSVFSYSIYFILKTKKTSRRKKAHWKIAAKSVYKKYGSI